ncbi:hypothetical protein MOUN0_J03994 [Monosporozyma unispora]|nr:hypothetical protein C6P44_001406 [Kazachstania unispora]
MAVVVLKKRNIRLLVITILLLGLTFTVLRSTNSNFATSTPASNKETTTDQALVDYESVEDPTKVRVGVVGDSTGEDGSTTSGSEDGEYNAEEEYSMLIKANPLVMFSKSYCPFSSGLKELLAEYFDFDPPIVVVELDQHSNGRELQEYIGKKTGRKTVPNLIVNGQSKGGFDDLHQLYRMTALYNSFESWSAGKFTVVKKKEKPGVNSDSPTGGDLNVPVIAGPDA